VARPPKLKVFCTSVGFYDALVAAPSQKAALKAWGTSTDLFGAGRASVIEDPDVQELALARPGEVVKRPRGNAHDLIEAMEAEEAKERASPAKPAPKRQAAVREQPRPAPDRTELDETERELDRAEREFRDRLATIAEARAALDREEGALRQGADRRLADLRARRDRLAAAYKRAAEPKRR
jgi:hypothetical protein